MKLFPKQLPYLHTNPDGTMQIINFKQQKIFAKMKWEFLKHLPGMVEKFVRKDKVYNFTINMWETKFYVFGLHLFSKYSRWCYGLGYLWYGLPLKDKVYLGMQKRNAELPLVTCTYEDMQNVYKKHIEQRV